jgi:hypothetical protein
MAKTPSASSIEARAKVVRKLSALFGWSAALQAATFIAAAWTYRYLAQVLLDWIGRTSATGPSSVADAIGNAIIVALDLFFAALIGFVGARRLLKSIVRATPHPMKPPTKPVPLAGLCAAAVVVVFSMLEYAGTPHLAATEALGWIFELLRDAAVVWLFWFAARRAIAPADVR